MIDHTIRKDNYRDFTIKLIFDNTEHDNPREWSNLGTMVCKHRKYNLGDEQANGTLEEHLYDLCELWDEDRYADRRLFDKILENKFVILPLYLYDHSGISMRTKPFSCKWDGGQVGFIYCSLEKALKTLEIKNWSKGWDTTIDWSDPVTAYSLRDCIEDSLRTEVETYNCYITGDICALIIEDEDEKEIYSSYGYYPCLTTNYKDRWFYVISEAQTIINEYIANFDYAAL